MRCISLVTHPNELSLNFLSIYHEILINEIALMRSNSIVEEGFDTGDAIIFYTTNLIHNPNTIRGLDYILLVYSVLNGLRRLECGYNLLSPIDPKELSKECRDKIIERIKNIIDVKKKNIVGRDSVERLLAELVFKLLEQGLINIIIPDDDSDSISPLLTHHKIKEVQNREHKVSDLKTMYEFRVYYELKHFFNAFEVSIDMLVDEFKKVLKEKSGISEELDIDKVQFKTLHGLLFKYSAHAASLPSYPAVMEANVLPFVIEPLPFPLEYKEDLSTQLRKLTTNLNINGTVLQILSKVLEDVMQKPLSDYQYEYLQEIFNRCFTKKTDSNRNERLLIALTSPTGTGKTYIFLLYMLAKLLDAKTSTPKRKPRVLLLYPRKALARDQLSKILEFVSVVNRELTSKNIERIKIGIFDGDSLKRKESIQELRGLKLHDKKLCHGFHNGTYVVFSASGNCENESDEAIQGRKIDWIKDVHDINVLREVDVLITNHSMLTKLLFENFSLSESGFTQFVKDIEMLILDEAHIYLDDEQLEVLVPTLLKLFFLRSKLRGLSPESLEELAKNLDMDIIISSATLTDSSMIVKKHGDNVTKLDSRSIIGFFKIRSSGQDSGLPESLENFLQVLFSQSIYNEFKNRDAIVYHDYDTIISRNMKSGYQWKGSFKVRIALVTHPYPQKESWTSLAEILIAVLHWINAIRIRDTGILGTNRAQALVFIDMKETLKDIFKVFLERQILEAQDHADRVLLTGRYDKTLINQAGERKRITALKAILEHINSLIQQKQANTAADIIYRDPLLKHFHVLHLYITPQDLKGVVIDAINKYEDLFKIRLYNKLEQLINSLNDYARYAYSKVIEGSWKNYEDLLRRLPNNYNATILVHHGDLLAKERNIIEAYMKGAKEPVPLIVMATSTLEIGVDIENLSLVVQYSSHPYSVELTQRFGRSGRHIPSFLTSTLILVLRNSGEDIRFVLDQESVEYVYNLEIPHVRDILRDKEAIIRSITRLLLLEDKKIKQEREHIIEEFLKMLENSLGSGYEDILQRWKNNVGAFPPSDRPFPQASVGDVVDYFYKNLWGVKQLLEELNKDDLANEIAAIYKKLEICKTYESSKLLINLIPLIAEMSSMQQDLRNEVLRDPSVGGDVKHTLENGVNSTYLLIRDLTYITVSELKKIAILNERDIMRFVLSHISPGTSDPIGRVKTSHYIYPVFRERKARDLEADEAFKRVRPLHTE